MNNPMFPEIVKQMTKRNETLKDLSNLLNITDISQVSRRLTGEYEWKLDEIWTLCKHYNMKFEKLFKRKEK